MKNQNRVIKNVIAVVFLLSITIYIAKYASVDLLMYLTVTVFAIFAFNFLVRGIPSFKSYFLSPFNIVSGKTLVEKQLDLPKVILIEKFKEVLVDAGFNVIDFDEDAGLLFATVGLSWKTWGENIYVEIINDGSVKFYSVSVVGVYTWGKNDCNLRKLVNTFEASLTI